MSKIAKPSNFVIEYTDWTKYLPWLAHSAFLLAISLVLARGMMLESMHEDISALASATAPPRGCGPAGSVVLDLLCCVPALLVLLRRVVDKTYIVRLTGSQALLIAFAVLALLSPIWASNKAQALVLAFHLAAAAALFWAMAQLVRSWSRLRIVAGACTGLLIVFIVQGIFYRFSDLPDFIKDWKLHARTEVMRSHGWQEEDFGFKQFEQKVLGGEMMGFEQSPNTFAAAIVLLGVVVASVGVQRIVNRDESGLIGAVFAPLPFAIWMIWYTHSNAAFATPIIAAGMLLAVAMWGGLLARRRTAAYLAGVALVVLGTIALVGHGLFHHSLPTASLNFRWRYWTAAARMFMAHPLLGVGYGNFGDAYLSFRVPAAAEEVKDPHNLVMRAATELGILGALLLVTWLARAWWEWTIPHLPPAPDTKAPASRTRTMFATIASLAIFATLINLLANVDFFTNINWVTYELLKRLIFAAVLLIGSAMVVVKSSTQTVTDDRPAPWILYGMLAALAVFLIHNTIDFSLFEIGPMLLFMMVGGAVVGVRTPSAAGLRKRTPVAIAAFSSLLLMWLVGLIFVAVPLTQAENRAFAGDEAFRKQDYRGAAEDYQAAFSTAPAADPDYATRAARALLALPDADGAARTNLILAISANPRDPLSYLSRARYNLERHPDQQDEIRKDYLRALQLNPNDIDTRQEYAKVLETFGDLKSAAEQYRLVIKTNEGFDPTEPKRLSEARVKEIQEKLRVLS